MSFDLPLQPAVALPPRLRAASLECEQALDTSTVMTLFQSPLTPCLTCSMSALRTA